MPRFSSNSSTFGHLFHWCDDPYCSGAVSLCICVHSSSAITSDTNAIAIIPLTVRKVVVRNSKHRRPLYWYAFLFTVRYTAHQDLIIMILRSKQVESALARYCCGFIFIIPSNLLQTSCNESRSHWSSWWNLG